MERTNALIDAAKLHRPECILQDRIYRIALTEKNKEQLGQTADLHPQYAELLSSEDILEQCKSGSSDSAPTLGGIRLSNGCKVVNVPAYLQGLWDVCQELSGGAATWSITDPAATTTGAESIDWKEKLKPFDTVVFAAGSGLFHDAILEKDAVDFPAQLIRGQSIEMTLPSSSNYSNEAMLCGKYLAPMTNKNQVLIGATHEFQADALDTDGVQSELRKRSYDIAPKVWDEGTVDKITIGYRVQSQRGKYGRMPIIGRSIHNDIHDNTWIFTGLSSRGLIYHGVYGDLLSTAILEDDESAILENHPDVYWWKQ